MSMLDKRIDVFSKRLSALEDRILALEKPVVEKMILAYVKAHPGSTIRQIFEPFRETGLWLAAGRAIYDRGGLFKQGVIVEERHGRGHPNTYTVKEA